jgi:ParB family chromosome partitioning protein
MKRDLLFLAERIITMIDHSKQSILIRENGMGKPKQGESPTKLIAAFLPKAEENRLGRILVEAALLLTIRSPVDAERIFREAARVYRIDVDTIATKVKQEFAANQRVKTDKKIAAKHKARKRGHTKAA